MQKNMIIKSAAIILTGVSILGLSACGNQKASNVTESTAKVALVKSAQSKQPVIWYTAYNHYDEGDSEYTASQNDMVLHKNSRVDHILVFKNGQYRTYDVSTPMKTFSKMTDAQVIKFAKKTDKAEFKQELKTFRNSEIKSDVAQMESEEKQYEQNVANDPAKVPVGSMDFTKKDKEMLAKIKQALPYLKHSAQEFNKNLPAYQAPAAHKANVVAKTDDDDQNVIAEQFKLTDSAWQHGLNDKTGKFYFRFYQDKSSLFLDEDNDDSFITTDLMTEPKSIDGTKFIGVTKDEKDGNVRLLVTKTDNAKAKMTFDQKNTKGVRVQQ